MEFNYKTVTTVYITDASETKAPRRGCLSCLSCLWTCFSPESNPGNVYCEVFQVII